MNELNSITSEIETLKNNANPVVDANGNIAGAQFIGDLPLEERKALVDFLRHTPGVDRHYPTRYQYWFDFQGQHYHFAFSHGEIKVKIENQTAS